MVETADLCMKMQLALACAITSVNEGIVFTPAAFYFENLPFSEVAKAHCESPYEP